MVIYQFSNAGHIFFIVVFSLLILLSIFACIFFFPLLKQSCESIASIAKGEQKEVSSKPAIILLIISLVIYSVFILLLAVSLINIPVYAKSMRNTDLDSCSICTGEIQSMESVPSEYRGEIVYYFVTFSVDNEEYCISENSFGVAVENINEFMVGEEITVYYQCIDGKNEVIRVTK